MTLVPTRTKSDAPPPPSVFPPVSGGGAGRDEQHRVSVRRVPEVGADRRDLRAQPLHGDLIGEGEPRRERVVDCRVGEVPGAERAEGRERGLLERRRRGLVRVRDAADGTDAGREANARRGRDAEAVASSRSVGRPQEPRRRRREDGAAGRDRDVDVCDGLRGLTKPEVVAEGAAPGAGVTPLGLAELDAPPACRASSSSRRSTNIVAASSTRSVPAIGPVNVARTSRSSAASTFTS